jgi:hypothetical protein
MDEGTCEFGEERRAHVENRGSDRCVVVEYVCRCGVLVETDRHKCGGKLFQALLINGEQCMKRTDNAQSREEILRWIDVYS